MLLSSIFNFLTILLYLNIFSKNFTIITFTLFIVYLIQIKTKLNTQIALYVRLNDKLSKRSYFPKFYQMED